MDCITYLLFTLLQIVANDKIISHIVIMILIKADLMGVCWGGGGGRECIRNKAQEDFVTRLYQLQSLGNVIIGNIYNRLLRA